MRLNQALLKSLPILVGATLLPTSACVALEQMFLYFPSYCQFWCTKLKSSGDLVSLFHLFSIDELDAINDLGEVREAT